MLFNFAVWSSLFFPINGFSGERCGPWTSCLFKKKYLKKREGWDRELHYFDN